MNNNPYPQLTYIPYDRSRAVEYARRWALERNPIFSDYTGIGGDCTNFVSQAIFAGTCVQNYTRDLGWYFISPENRAPAWTSVEYFYDFMTENEGVGPFGRDATLDELEIGDVIQLGQNDQGFYHTLLVVGFSGGDTLIAAQTNDAFERALSSYDYDYARYIKILGIRFEIPDAPDCYPSVLDGISLAAPVPARPDAMGD